MPDDAVRLLDAAVPPIPPGLRAAPLEGIRQRVRRRRTIAVSTCAGLAVLTITVAGGLLSARPGADPATHVGDRAATATPTQSPSASRASTPAARVPGSFLTARVDRSGLKVTVFVTSPGACQVWTPDGSSVDEQADQIVISVPGAPAPVECGRDSDTPVEVVLSRPLGARTIADGLAPDATVLVVRDSDLPLVPAPWWEVPIGFHGLTGTSFSVAYTTPGGPDLLFEMRRGQLREPVLEQVTIGGHDAVIVDFGGEEAVCWEVGDLVYSMTLIPGEGATTSREELHSVLALLT